jgi:outer membrane protein assembly factor BamD
MRTRVRSWCTAVAVVGVSLIGAACATKLDLKKFNGDNEALYRISYGAYQKHDWDDAVTGFEKLTLDLPAHDTLLSRSYFYLAQAHEHKGEFLLAAQSYNRLGESFPDDSLADRALFDAGRAYGRMWHRPSLDAQYGTSALASFEQMVTLYPGSKLVPDGQREIARLQEWFAIKDYRTGTHYQKRGAYDSAIIYYKDVIKNYPTTLTARSAALRLVDAYRRIKYRDDANDLCTQLRAQYPQDHEVRDRCGISTASVEPVAPASR